MAKKTGAKPHDIPDTIRLVGEQTLPLQVGTVAFTREGRLVPHDHDVPLCFSFVYAGVPFAAEVTAGPTPLVRLTADLGALLLDWKPCLALLGELLAANPLRRRPPIPEAGT